MSSSSIISRLLVIKKVGNKILLPAENDISFDVHDIQISSYSMFRVENFDSETGVLLLKKESGFCDESNFKTSIEVNSQLLLSLNITQLNFMNNSRGSSKSKTYYKSATEHNRVKSDYNFEGNINTKKNENIELKSNYENLIKESFALSFDEIRFEDEKVVFNRFIHMFSKNLEFEIPNRYLRREFDSIKDYFKKVLKANKINIEISVEYSGNVINKKLAVSSQILQITNNLIEEVEDLFVEQVFLASEENVIAVNKKLNELADLFGKDEINEPEWLLNKLISQKKTKHYFHLRFLSGKHLHDITNLRVTGKPTSFVFLIFENNNYFLVWETYNTNEATYIWRLMQSTIEGVLMEIEELINKIKWLRKSNKLNYLNERPIHFKRIEHDYSGKDMGFEKWKKELDAFFLSG